jgi:predicted RNA-binding protein YlxR (DUF448 family)/ribosomal protein L30E
MDGSRTRRCIVSGDILPEGRLVRFAVGPDGQVVPDIEAKLPGRGLWVQAERRAVEQAVSKGLFSRAAGEPVKASAGLASLTEARLVERMLDHLGLARRAGDLILGFDQVERALRAPGAPAVVIEAADAAADGQRKLQAAARSAGIAPFVIGALTSAELSLALGRSNVVHAALKSGRIAEQLVFDAGRLNGFRPLNRWVWAGFSEGEAGKTG